jgi:glutamate synthase (NADPH/NADH) small chain
LRQGASEVTQVELLPAAPEQRAAGNPWPQWPVVFRTSSSQEEGGVREFGLRTRRLLGEQGQLRALEAVPVALDGGRLVEIAGAPEVVLPADVLVLALGFSGADSSQAAEQLGLGLTPAGNIQVAPDFATNVPGVFAAGDASRGASLVVWAISDGREAARGVDAYLRKRPSRLPTRGAHVPFGGR